MLLIAGVDPLGRITDEEIALPLHAGMTLYDRHADFLGGAGTATTMKSARCNCAGSVVTSSRVAAAKSAAATSPVGSTWRLYASTFARDRSKPIVAYCFPNSIASGRPT